MTKRRTTAGPKSKKTPVTFTLQAPQADAVLVAGTFCDWQTHSCHLKKDKTGLWKATLSLPPGRYEYRFLVDGDWCDDPKCLERVTNPFGTENCVLEVLRDVAQAERTKIGREVLP